MKILFIGLNEVGQGTYWRMFHFARHIVRQGHTVTLVAMSRTGRWRITTAVQQGVRIVKMPNWLWGPLRSGWDLWETVNRVAYVVQHQFDLIHAFESRPTVLFPALAGKYLRRTPLVFDWCDWFGKGGVVEERSSRFQRLMLRHVDTFFEERFRRLGLGTTVICHTLQQKAIDAGLAPRSIALIRDGASIDEFAPLDKMASRRALNLPLDQPLIGYVGQIFQRDAELMAQAFDNVQARCPQARLLLIGYVNRPVETMVQEASAVIRTGRIPFSQLNQHIAACDLCWLPYRDSGANRGRWPMKFNDYMATGRPTVATAVGDVEVVMREHEVGVLAAPTPHALAAATVQLLGDPARAAYLGSNARKVAENHFSWQHQTAQLLNFYERALSMGD